MTAEQTDNRTYPPAPRWYCDRASLQFIAFRYVPLLGALNLLWEIAQLPLYTLWEEGLPTLIAYTALSERINTVARGSWAYSALMPIVNLGGFEIGLSPLLQRLVVPPVALWLAGRQPARGLGRRTLSELNAPP